MFGSSSDGSRSPSAESDARGMSAGSDDVFAEKVLVKDYEVITLRMFCHQYVLSACRSRGVTANGMVLLHHELLCTGTYE